MQFRPYLLQETNLKSIQNEKIGIAILPWGATEAHNFHLPYGTDNLQNEYITAEVASHAWKEGVRVMVLPNMPFGANCQQLDIPFTINMNPSTQRAVLNDVLRSLYDQGTRKFVVFNGHGGNDFKQMIRELKPAFPGMFIGQINWFHALLNWEEFFEDTGDHAGEMETSIMMKIAPQLVRPLEEAGDGGSKDIIFKARREGWLWTPREWTRVSADTGIGNPKASTAQKGEEALRSVVANIVAFLRQLQETDPEEIYE
jgi:creatinine amidohydrolase